MLYSDSQLLRKMVFLVAVVAFVGIWLVSQLILSFVLPHWGTYPYGMLAQMHADYATWNGQSEPLLPPLDPRVAQAAERDAASVGGSLIVPAAVLSDADALASSIVPSPTPEPTASNTPIAKTESGGPSFSAASAQATVVATSAPVPGSPVAAVTSVAVLPSAAIVPPTSVVPDLQAPSSTPVFSAPGNPASSAVSTAPAEPTEVPPPATPARPTRIPTATPAVPTSAPGSPTATPTRMPGLLPTASSTPTAPLPTPTIPTPTASPVTLTSVPTATSTPTQPLPTKTFTPSPTPTTLPTVTLTPRPGVVGCQNVLFEPMVELNGSQTILRVNISNPGQRSIEHFNMLVRVLKNGNEGAAQTEASSYISTSAPINKSGKIDYYYSNADAFTANTSYVLASYESSSAANTGDDAFRVRFSVNGINCAASGAFPPAPLGTDQPISITFINPASDGQTFIDREDMALRTKVSSGATSNKTRLLDGDTDGTGISWVSFTIVNEATEKTVWDWIEYLVPYCGFGTIDSKCIPPPLAWWENITDGHYRLEVIVRANDGGSAFATRRFQVLHPTPTPTMTRVPTSTPTSTMTSTATSVLIATPTPTNTPPATATDLPVELPTDTVVSLPTSTATDTPTDMPTSTSTSTPTVEPSITPTIEPSTTPIVEPTSTDEAMPAMSPFAVQWAERVGKPR